MYGLVKKELSRPLTCIRLERLFLFLFIGRYRLQFLTVLYPPFYVVVSLLAAPDSYIIHIQSNGGKNTTSEYRLYV